MKRLLYVLDWFAWAVIAIALFAYFGAPYIGAWQGARHPIVSYTVFQFEPIGHGQSRAAGRFYLNRADCEFVRMEWQIVGVQRNAPVNATFPEGAQVRDVGWHDVAWILDANADLLRTRSIAAVYHKCPLWPWPIITHFYP